MSDAFWITLGMDIGWLYVGASVFCAAVVKAKMEEEKR